MTTDFLTDVSISHLDAILREKPDAIWESSLDSMKLSNSDVGLDWAVEKNNGRFFVCNADILTEKR
jgi:hypothetical protein